MGFVVIVCAAAGCWSRAAHPNEPVAPEPQSVAPDASGDDPTAEASSTGETLGDEAPAPSSVASSTLDADPNDATSDDESTPVGRPPAQGGAISIEAVYRANEMKYPEGRKEKKAFLVDLERWNNGGFSDGARWHAVPRVVIGEPSVRSGKIDTRALMKRLRAEQYMTVRNCFDPALRDTPDLSGRTVLRLKIRGDRVVESSVSKGKVSDSRKHPTAMSSKVASCLADAFDGAHVHRSRSASATVLVSIDLWPGDAPMPNSPRPAHGKIALDSIEKIAAAHTNDVAACTASDHGAWGRLALEIEVDESGAIQSVDEVESTFPVRGAAACMREKLKNIRLPTPSPAGSNARVIVAFRVAPR